MDETEIKGSAIQFCLLDKLSSPFREDKDIGSKADQRQQLTFKQHSHNQEQKKGKS